MNSEYGMNTVLGSLNYPKPSYIDFVMIFKKYVHFTSYKLSIFCYIDLYAYIIVFDYMNAMFKNTTSPPYKENT